jgi:LAO/AO transport system kinase
VVGLGLVDDDSALRITPGIESPSSLDPEQARRFQHRRRRPRLSLEAYLAGIRAGDRVVLGQAITLIESGLPADRELASELVERCLERSGASHSSVRVGITGVPGAGKSTFIEALGLYLIEELGGKVAVLAVDPSSPVSGGSILGDKTRMARLGMDTRAFIRPSPARGSLGGVAQRTRETVLLCEAAGFSNVLVETVGVGQSEIAVAGMVDFFLMLAIAGAGDELQGIKRGIIEMSDLIAINKADGDNRRPAEISRRQYESALELFPPREGGWRPRVVTCSALNRENIAGVWDIVKEHHRGAMETGWLGLRRREQVRRWMLESVEQTLAQRFFTHSGVREALPGLEAEVLEGRMSSFRAARRLLDIYDGAGPSS